MIITDELKGALEAGDDDFTFAFRRRGAGDAGFWCVYDPDGGLVSRHTDIVYAQASAIQHAQEHKINGVYRIQPPDRFEVETMGFRVRGKQAPEPVAPPAPPDEPGVIALTTTSVAVNEGSNATITASRTSGSDGAVAVDWAVSDALTAPASGTLNWAGGDSAPKSATPLASLVESTTQGTVTLSNPRRTDGGDVFV